MTKENKELLQAAIRIFGQDNQMDMVVEEMAELMVAMNKWRRYSGTIPETHKNIQEEVADVQIMLDQMKIMFGEDEIKAIEESKLNRLNERLVLEEVELLKPNNHE